MANVYCNFIEIAVEPIRCWKLMEEDKNTGTYSSLSPYDSLSEYKLGERIQVKEEERLKIITRPGFSFVRTGFRCYKEIPESMKDLPFMSAIIPKGSRYVEGVGGEYASEEIIIYPKENPCFF